MGKQITAEPGCFACGFPETKETKAGNAVPFFYFLQGIHLAGSKCWIHIWICVKHINSFLFVPRFAADSRGYHTASLCHLRNAIYMHQETKIIFRVPILPYIITKRSKPTAPTVTVPAEPELFPSLHCSPCGIEIQGQDPGRELGILPASQEQSRARLRPCLRSPNLTLCYPCLSTELIN